MGSSDGRLSRQEIVELLRRLGELAEQRGIRIDLFLVGGAAMALAYNSQRTTADLDAVFEPKQLVYELARIVATESEPELGEGWLNDGVKAFLPGPDAEAYGVLADLPGISVTVASPKYLFVLKALAARESDEDDLRRLYGLCGFSNADEALDAVAAAYPTVRIRPSVEFLVRGIAELS